MRGRAVVAHRTLGQFDRPFTGIERPAIGCLVPGKRAVNQLDLAGALHDPLAALVFCAPVKADYTVVGGRFVVKDGHMDRVVRHAINEGVSPIMAIQMATINTAEHFGLTREMGMIAPGRWADVVLVAPEVHWNTNKGASIIVTVSEKRDQLDGQWKFASYSGKFTLTPVKQ